MCSSLINLQSALPITVAISLPSCPTPLPALFRSFQSLLRARHNRLKEKQRPQVPVRFKPNAKLKRGNRNGTCCFCKLRARSPGNAAAMKGWHRKQNKNESEGRTQRTGLAHSYGHRAVSAHAARPVINSPTPAAAL